MSQAEALHRIEQAARSGETTLDLMNLDLTSLPPDIGKLTNLTTLYLWNNQLTSLPPEIGNLTNLTILILGENQLTSLPPEIGNLTNLTKLYLWENRVEALPHEIGSLANLTTLQLRGNQLTSLPPEIGSLTNLTELHLYDNQLTSLPPDIGNLTNLRELTLWSNQLTSLPPSIANLANLTALRLGRNPLPDDLLKLAERDVPAALSLIRAQAAEGEPLYEAKLLLVGEGDVGKTCLLRALQGKPFEHQSTTKAMEIAREALPIDHPDDGVIINLNAWDFGGQKDYRITHQFFFTPRALYLVVWDPRSGHDKCDVDGWITRIRLRVGEDAVILVVATHVETGDPPPAVSIDPDDLRRKHGKVIAGFFEVDSKTGCGIDALRTAIARSARTLPAMGDKFPKTWKSARDEVIALAKGNVPWIDRARFSEICDNRKMQDPDAARALLVLMDTLGQVVYYGRQGIDSAHQPPATPGEQQLGDIVILRPEWLAKAVCFILEDQETRNRSGVLRYNRLKEIWHDKRTKNARYAPDLHPYFLALMNKYGVSYELEDRKSSLVPQLIKRGRPDSLRWYPEQPPSDAPQLALSCEMDEVPTGLVPLMIVRTHRFSSEDTHWELGAFLNHTQHGEAHMALVDRELMFTVRGEYPSHFLSLLSDSFETLVGELWPGLINRYRLTVPCPMRTDEDDPCPGRIPLNSLRTYYAEGDTHDRCPRCTEKLDIGRLLSGLATPGVNLEERFDKLEAMSAATFKGVENLRSFAAERFRLLLASINNETAQAPGMFTLLPDNNAWTFLAGQNRCSLTFWCEHPDGPHPLCPVGSGGEGEYSVTFSRDWLIKAAPYITWTARVLKIALPIAGSIIKAGADELLPRDLKTKLDIMEKCASALPGGELETHSKALKPTGFVKRPEGFELREFHDLINDQIKGRRWGGLRRVQADSGDYLWLCPDHYKEFVPELPIIPT